MYNVLKLIIFFQNNGRIDLDQIGVESSVEEENMHIWPFSHAFISAFVNQLKNLEIDIDLSPLKEREEDLWTIVADTYNLTSERKPTLYIDNKKISDSVVSNKEITTKKQLQQLFDSSKNGSIFRGENNTYESLLPSAFRDGISEENSIIMKKQYGMMANVDMDEIDGIARAQHHGLPTNLLDWSTKLGIALFFATDINIDDDVEHITLYELDKKTSDFIDSIPEAEERTQDFLFYRAKWFNDRIASQESVFSYHKEACDILKSRTLYKFYWERGTFPINKYLIKKELIPDIRKILCNVNINRYTIYKDEDNLAKFIKEEA